MERPSRGGRFAIMLDEMQRQASATIPACLKNPQISLLGEMLEEMVEAFLTQLADAEKGDGSAGPSAPPRRSKPVPQPTW